MCKARSTGRGDKRHARHSYALDPAMRFHRNAGSVCDSSGISQRSSRPYNPAPCSIPAVCDVCCSYYFCHLRFPAARR